MALNCGSTVLTGQDGSIYFQPAGTQFCLHDHTDFPAGSSITVPVGHDFHVGDPVSFKEEGTGNLDSALTAGTIYHIVDVAATSIKVSATSGGAAITLTGDGGAGSADTPGSANHIAIDYAEFAAVCQVKSFSMDLSRSEIDTTALPCGPSATSKFAPFKTMQAGFAAGSGEMQVQFTTDQTSLANRLLANSMMKRQSGAEVRLFISTVEGSTQGVPDLSKSLYIEAPISIMGFTFNVTPEEAIIGSLKYNLSGQPTKLLGITL